MRVINLKSNGAWKEILNACRTTSGKEPADREPSERFRGSLIISEHSPIRMLEISWTWVDLPYWVSTHFVRHKVGIEHWVQSQRSDRTGSDREEKPQSAPVTHSCKANAQAIINISRRRLCRKASVETMVAWKMFLLELDGEEPELAKACQPECVYRNGICPEPECCGYIASPEYQEMNLQYMKFLIDHSKMVKLNYKNGW